MSKKEINFFEKNIEKIVLGIVVVISLFLLTTKVLMSNKYVEYRGKKYGPAKIDELILEKAQDLSHEIKRKPEPKEEYVSPMADFLAVYNSSLNEIDTNLYLPIPQDITEQVAREGSFAVPEIGKVLQPSAGHIRSVAYIPTEEVDEENPYEEAEVEPEDLDLVTIEAKFDVISLYESFEENFLGNSVPVELRDPCLADPVFAAVDLQRQELQQSGRWSDWKSVPRTKVDDFKNLFEIIENVNDMPAGGIKVRLLQFKDAFLMRNLLQPRPYSIASQNKTWLPPTLHQEYVDMQDRLSAIERREKLLERKKELEEKRNSRDNRRDTSPRRRQRSTETDFGAGGDFGGGAGMNTPQRSTTSRRRRRDDDKDESFEEMLERRKQELDDQEIFQRYQSLLINEKTDLEQLQDLLTFWAYDDTVEPEKTYRYRVRLGIYNPVAGTSMLAEQFDEYEDQAILWSEFSDVTEPINIPAKLYFFPKNVQEASGTVTFQISRYVLGYWYSEDFMVKRGEMIGAPAEYIAQTENEQDYSRDTLNDPFNRQESYDQEDEDLLIPETVDYSTGALMLDIDAVNDWAGERQLNPRAYYKILYSYDGSDIKQMPVKMKFWNDELVAKYNEIRRLEKEPREPLRSFDVEEMDYDRSSKSNGMEFEQFDGMEMF